MRRTRVLLALTQRVLHVNHAQSTEAALNELWDAIGWRAEAREVLMLGAMEPAERVELVPAHLVAEHLAEAFEGPRAERDPLVLGEVEVCSHVQIKEEPKWKQIQDQPSTVDGGTEVEGGFAH